jgi:2-amino-4-hydroxy-6-hydroxymethyldihydropteridine diphosphokinase
MPLTLVGLGSNLGDRSGHLRKSITRLASLPRTAQVAESRFLTSTPIGGPGEQPEFLNAAVLLETVLAPHEVLASLHQIENDLGRKRQVRWGPRSIDLDLLLYDDLVLETPDLIIPHPRMAFRRFVLAPAVETAPDMVHPEIGWTVHQLWEHLNSAPNYVALDGGPPEFRRALAEQVAQETPAKAILFPPAPGKTPRATWQDVFPTADSLGESGAAISDFWLDAVVTGLGQPVGQDQSELEDDLRWLRSHALAPKLLVRLEASPAQLSFRGPVLKLKTRDLSDAAAEVVAAIQAMR